MDFWVIGGTHTQSVDNRGRAAIASGFMRELRGLSGVKEGEPIEVVVSSSYDGQGVGVYPLPVFQKLITNLKRASSKNADAMVLKDALVNDMEYQTLDKQNRIRIPLELMEECGIKEYVSQLGSEDHIRLVSKEEKDRMRKERKAAMPEISKRALLAIGQLESEETKEG